MLLCRYLDFMEEYRNIEQLREETASDQLILGQAQKLKKHGIGLTKRMNKYLADHTKVFKEGHLWVGNYDIKKQVASILETFDSLFGLGDDDKTKELDLSPQPTQ